MDASKLDSKIVRMMPVNKRSVVGSMPAVKMSEILRMKERARKENKTLAQIFREETKPELFNTVSLKELRELQARALEDDISVGKAIINKLNDDAEAEEDEEPIDSPPDVEPQEPEKDTTEDAEPVAEDADPEAEDEKPGEVPNGPEPEDEASEEKSEEKLEDILDAHTYADLKDFAKANDMKAKSNIKKADLIELIMLTADRSMVESYFGE